MSRSIPVRFIDKTSTRTKRKYKIDRSIQVRFIDNNITRTQQEDKINRSIPVQFIDDTFRQTHINFLTSNITGSFLMGEEYNVNAIVNILVCNEYNVNEVVSSSLSVVTYDVYATKEIILT